MKLFDDKSRTDKEPARHLEDRYKFYDRSAMSVAGQIRDQLNQWFEQYPDPHKSELKSLFATAFSAAFYELFLHELFQRQGFTLTPHPTVEGTNKKPDFLVTGNGTEFYLEAKDATDTSQDERSQENRIKQLYDTLTRCDSPNFFLNIEELTITQSVQ